MLLCTNQHSPDEKKAPSAFACPSMCNERAESAMVRVYFFHHFLESKVCKTITLGGSYGQITLLFFDKSIEFLLKSHKERNSRADARFRENKSMETNKYLCLNCVSCSPIFAIFVCVKHCVFERRRGGEREKIAFTSFTLLPATPAVGFTLPNRCRDFFIAF